MNAPVAAALAAKDFKSDTKPVWCPGCGDYGVLTSLTRALADLALRPEATAVVSGIGCSSRMPAYTTCYAGVRAMTATDTGDPGTGAEAIPTVDDLLARAYTMELEAMERYEELAAQMELHSNLDVAGVFHKLAGAERKHVEAMARDLAERGIAVSPGAALAAPGAEGLETALFDALDYLMTPYHALRSALESELRAFAFFANLSHSPAPDEIRRLASEFAEEEKMHVELVREWLARVPKPREDWDYDPDEPRILD
jgi:rubrerythrin